MPSINEIADRYVIDVARLDPVRATQAGIEGFDDRLSDLSPAGFAQRADLDRQTLAALDATAPADETDLVAKEAMQERLDVAVARYDAGEITSELNVLTSGLHEMRGVFDVMPLHGEQAAANIAARLGEVPQTLAQLRQTLTEAAAGGHVTSKHQIVEVAKQCDAWTDPQLDDYYPGLARRVIQAAELAPAMRDRLTAAAAQARAATGEFAEFLRRDLLPLGRTEQAVGEERYALASQYFLGTRVDLREAYAWGFDELARLESQMRQVANQIQPGSSVAEAVAALEADPRRNIAGKEAFREWMQQLADQTIAQLHGVHFDIPEPIRRIEACIAPTADGGVYYTAPSEDLSRPGRMWWSVPEGITEFSTWREVTTVYHEGVPGHHLQTGQAVVGAGQLNRWRRLMCWCAGHGEGWALYAERLMDELGYFTDPGEELGLLDSQAFRALRVILDIGLHMQLPIPADNAFGLPGGEPWTPEVAWEFLRGHNQMDSETLRFELNRYLGWPGQAPSYKLGERIWLQARQDAKARRGARFDLRQFHHDALSLGSLGLDPLRAALARL